MSANTTYFPPYVDSQGLQIPTYQADENYLVQGTQNVFGTGIYLGNDSQGFQWLALFAKMAYDTSQAMALVYNNQSPVTAIGTGLDNIVAINGLTRLPATNSTATVVITGNAYTTISQAIVSDTNGNLWNLPSQFSIGSNGTVSVTATCQSTGPVTALANTITGIQTPTSGWISVTNPNAASVGTALETDSALRARQAISVENPSQALTNGILGAVLAVPGVTTGVLYENDTSSTLNYLGNGYNPGGFPAHSITVVVNGGSLQAVANAIYLRKTPGAYTNGNQIYNFTDAFGVVTPIRFYLVSTQTIVVAITIEPLNNYSSVTATAIQTAVAAYINSLKIGQTVLNSGLEYAAMSVNSGIQYPYFGVISVLAGIGAATSSSDIQMQFNQQAVTTTVSISVNSSSSAPACIFNLSSNSQNLTLI